MQNKEKDMECHYFSNSVISKNQTYLELIMTKQLLIPDNHKSCSSPAIHRY